MRKNELFDIALGGVLKEYRLKNKYSLQKIADYLGVTRQMVFYYEKGNSPLTVTQLMKICSVYGINYIDVLKEAQKQIYEIKV